MNDRYILLAGVFLTLAAAVLYHTQNREPDLIHNPFENDFYEQTYDQATDTYTLSFKKEKGCTEDFALRFRLRKDAYALNLVEEHHTLKLKEKSKGGDAAQKVINQTLEQSYQKAKLNIQRKIANDKGKPPLSEFFKTIFAKVEGTTDKEKKATLKYNVGEIDAVLPEKLTKVQALLIRDELETNLFEYKDADGNTRTDATHCADGLSIFATELKKRFSTGQVGTVAIQNYINDIKLAIMAHTLMKIDGFQSRETVGAEQMIRNNPKLKEFRKKVGLYKIPKTPSYGDTFYRWTEVVVIKESQVIRELEQQFTLWRLVNALYMRLYCPIGKQYVTAIDDVRGSTGGNYEKEENGKPVNDDPTKKIESDPAFFNQGLSFEPQQQLNQEGQFMVQKHFSSFVYLLLIANTGLAEMAYKGKNGRFDFSNPANQAAIHAQKKRSIELHKD